MWREPIETARAKSDFETRHLCFKHKERGSHGLLDVPEVLRLLW